MLVIAVLLEEKRKTCWQPVVTSLQAARAGFFESVGNPTATTSCFLLPIQILGAQLHLGAESGAWHLAGIEAGNGGRRGQGPGVVSSPSCP